MRGLAIPGFGPGTISLVFSNIEEDASRSMRRLRRISPIILLAACLWLPADAEAGYDTAFLTLLPAAGTPPFTWTFSEATAAPSLIKQERMLPSGPPASPDPDESLQNALIGKDAPVTVSRPPCNPAVWSAYIDRFIIPSLRTALATRLTQPLPLQTSPKGALPTAFEDDYGQPIEARADSPEPFIEIVIPIEAASPGPPTAMHVQLLVPEKTILRILREVTGTASASGSAPAPSSSSDRIQRAKAFQTYLDNVSETLKDEATVQQYFRTANTTSSIVGVLSTLGQIIALGTLPLHALFTTIPMVLYYAVTAALGEDPLNLNWKLFSSASNSLLRTTFSDTLIPVP